MPLLRDELANHASDGLAIVGVIFKDSTDPAREFAESFGATWPSATDPDGAIARAYRVVAPPQSYFIDRAGVLRSIQIGEILQSDFDRQYPAIAG
jgi:peroxiredoxin